MNAYSLIFSSNNLTGEIPSTFCTNTTRAKLLDLSKNKLRGAIPADLGKCMNLTNLNLAENDLQGGIPERLGNLTSLLTLNLYGNTLNGEIPPSVRNCTFLQVFDVGSNQIQGEFPIFTRQLKHLRILNLASNKFKGTIPDSLFELKFLQILDLSQNHLSGPIPKNLGKLDAMVHEPHFAPEFASPEQSMSDYFNFDYDFVLWDQVTLWIKGRASQYEKIFKEFRFMDLSHNKLSGNIPPEVGLLRGLNALNLSRNKLSSSIPESIGALVELESLDLSGNKLSGKIPLELLNLTFLAVFNVSDNRLSGLIPQGKQFATFEGSSFARNPDLHGPPLENRTKKSQDELHKREKDAQAEAEPEKEEDKEMKRWWAVSVGLNYGVGFATVIVLLCFHIRWRVKYFSYLDSLMPHLFGRQH